METWGGPLAGGALAALEWEDVPPQHKRALEDALAEMGEYEGELFHERAQQERLAQQPEQPDQAASQGAQAREALPPTLQEAAQAGAQPDQAAGQQAGAVQVQQADQQQAQPVQRPSQALGLDASRGSLSAAAVAAVDGGASPVGVHLAEQVQAKAQAQQADAQAQQTGQASLRRASGGEVVLQNRDRSSAASVAQMQEIAQQPDYWRAGASRTMSEGAPVVFGDVPASAVLGRQEVVADGMGERVGTRYAVVEADDVISSHRADGLADPAYARGEAGRLRAVAGNGRAAGLRAAFERGTAAGYRQELLADAQALGLDAQQVQAMRAPMLVRVMDAADVRADMADRSNVTGTQRLSPVEEAANDARRLDLTALQFDEQGRLSAASVRGFVQAMPVAERGNLLNPDGSPTRQAQERIMAAAFKQAYGHDELVRLVTQAADPDARVVLSALAEAAPQMAALTDAGEFDIRQAVADAAVMAVNAARQSHSLADWLRNADLAMPPEAFVVARFLAQNMRSARRMADGLKRFAQLALEQLRIAEENLTQGGMFGQRPTLSRAQLLESLSHDDFTHNAAGPDAREPGAGQALAAQPGGPEPAGQGAERAGAGRAGEAGGAADGRAGGDAAQRQALGAQAEEAKTLWKARGVPPAATEVGLAQTSETPARSASTDAGTVAQSADQGKAQPDLVQVRATNGRKYWVEREDLAGDAPALATYTADGRRQVVRLARERLQGVVQQAGQKAGASGSKAQAAPAHKDKPRFSLGGDEAAQGGQVPADEQFRQTESAYGGQAAYEQAKAAGKTKLDYRQWVQVRTPAFKAWFGDWEGDPENASKVVDAETGEPMVVYHGTGGEFTVFEHGNQGFDDNESDGYFFTDNERVAQEYAEGAYDGKVMPVFLRINNPFDALRNDHLDRLNEAARDGEIRGPRTGMKMPPVEYGQNVWGVIANRTHRLAHNDVMNGLLDWIQNEERHDGAILTDGIRDTGEHLSFVVFEANQIKSATENTGAFDAGEEDIRFRLGDEAGGGDLDDQFAQMLKRAESHVHALERAGRGRSNAELRARQRFTRLTGQQESAAMRAWAEQRAQWQSTTAGGDYAQWLRDNPPPPLEPTEQQRHEAAQAADRLQDVVNDLTYMSAYMDAYVYGQEDESVQTDLRQARETLAMLQAVQQGMRQMQNAEQDKRDERRRAIKQQMQRAGGPLFDKPDAAGRQWWEDQLAQQTQTDWGKVADVWLRFAQSQNAFRYPSSGSASIEDVASEMSHGRIKASWNGDKTIILSDDGGRVFIYNADGKTPYVYAMGAGGKKKKSSGTLFYAIAHQWAFNNGKTIVPDSGLTSINSYRRTSNMISAALRAGSTRHMKPHGDQGIKGWKEGADRANLAAMLRREMDTVFAAAPQLQDVRYDVATGRFRHARTGAAIGEKRLASMAESALGDQPWSNAYGVGENTAKRAIVSHTLLEMAANGQDMAAARAPADTLLYSRSPDTRQAYEARIDELFAGGKARLDGARVLDRSDVLGLLGHADKPVVLAEGKVLAGQQNHPRMTAQVWKKVPEWLENPAAVFESETDGGLVVIAPELVGGAPVSIIVRPDAVEGGALQAHLLLNAYDRSSSTPFMRWIGEGLLKFADTKKFPALFEQTSGRRLPGIALLNKPGTARILTEKHLAAWRRVHDMRASRSKGAASEGLTPELARKTAALQTAINAIHARWPNAPEATVVADMDDARIPQAVRAAYAGKRSQGARGRVRGFHYQGRVWLVAAHVKDGAEAAQVMAHETLGHHGLQGLFGAALQSVLDRIGLIRRAAVVAKARAYGLHSAPAQVAHRLSDAQIWHSMTPRQRREAAEEVLVNLAETQPSLGMVREALAAIRAWLRQHVPGFAQMKVSDEELIREYVLPARGWVTRGQQMRRQGADYVHFQLAWHGSPHSGIEKTGFKLNKIGSGEGAQAYGWGIYFASRREVAEGYRKALSLRERARQFMRELPEDADADEVLQALEDGELSPALAQIVRALAADDWLGFDYPAQALDAAFRELDAYDPSDALREAIRQHSGQLYSADIPEDKDLLDWDKPLVKQPAKVKRRIGKWLQGISDEMFPMMGLRNKLELVREMQGMNGATFYDMLHSMLGDAPGASRALLDAGIPGLRYLDGQSRRDGEGTHNYVIWDEALLTPEAAQIEPQFSLSPEAGQRQIEPVALTLQGWQGTRAQLRALATGWYSDRLQGTSVHNADMDVDVGFSSEGKRASFATSGNLRVGWRAEMVRALPDLVQRAVKVAERAPDGRRTRDTHAFHVLVAPLAINGRDYATKITLRQAAAGPEPRHKFYDVTGVEIENGPVLSGLKGEGQGQHPLPTGTEPSPQTVAALAAAVNVPLAQEGEAGPRFSLSPMKDADANIRRGREALAKAITDKTSVHRAMFRNGLGWVDFVWGDAKRGVAHILHRRQAADGMSQSQATQFLDKAIAAIAKGQEMRRTQAGNGALRVQIEYDGAEVALVRQPGSNAWMLTAFEVRPDAAGRVATPSAATGDAPIRSRRIAAGSASIGQNAANGKPRFDLAGGNKDAKAKWAAPDSSWLDDVLYQLQDKHVDTLRVQQAIERAGQRIDDDQNVRQAEELYHGRVARRLQEFMREEVQPLLALMQRHRLSMQDVQDYLHARHAKEANALIAQRDPSMPDGGSGMTNAEADALLAELNANVPRRLALQRVAEQVDAMIEGTREALVDYGLESEKTVQLWRDQFAHYVPLMREQPGEEGRPTLGTGQGFSVKGREVKGRTGSTRQVVDVFANIVMQRERALVRGEKNRVALALLGLVRANPNPDVWRAGPPPAKRTLGKDGKVRRQVDPNYKSRDVVLVAKVKQPNGSVKEVAVTFNENNARALRMARALKNLDAQEMSGAMGVMARATRYFAAVNTQYNPVFGLVNLMRDAPAALINLESTPLAGEQWAVTKNALPALRGVYKALRAERAGGQPKDEWGRLLVQFQQDGGATGYRDQFATSADRARALQRLLTPQGWMDSGWGRMLTLGGALRLPAKGAQEGFGVLMDWLTDYNDAMENALRLAAYKAALDKGMSRAQAASIAKSLTVNFNRKGAVAQQAGALYAFFNASMQSTARIAQTLAADGRLTKAGRRVVLGGLALGVLQALALAAAGLDDDDVPPFVQEKSLIIPTGGKSYVTIPMPLGYHVIPGLGRHAAQFALGGFKDWQQRGMDVLGMLAEALNPIGNAGWSAQTFTPTVLDPWVALGENRDWAGREIARKSRNPAEPGFRQARDTATPVARWLAEVINAASGGNAWRAGVSSPTPDQIDYLIGVATGGVGREAAKLWQGANALMDGEELPAHKRFLLGRFYGNADSASGQQQRFYATVRRLEALETEIKGMRADGEVARAAQLAKDNPQVRLIAASNAAQLQMKKLREHKRRLLAQGAGRDQVRAVEEQMARLARGFNERVARERP